MNKACKCGRVIKTEADDGLFVRHDEICQVTRRVARRRYDSVDMRTMRDAIDAALARSKEGK